MFYCERHVQGALQKTADRTGFPANSGVVYSKTNDWRDISAEDQQLIDEYKGSWEAYGPVWFQRNLHTPLEVSNRLDLDLDLDLD